MSRPLRVVLTGSECTGKTELAERLARHYDAPWSPEHARAYFARRQALGVAELTAADVEPIARGQLQLENAARAEAARVASPLVLHDTDLVSTVVYAAHYYGACLPWIERSARARLGDLYLLCEIDVPWAADAQRDRPEAREEIQAQFRGTLAEFGARVVEVRGDRESRFRVATAAIAGFLGG